MIINLKWNLILSIYLFYISYVNCETDELKFKTAYTVSKEQYVNPHSFYYDKHTKSHQRILGKSADDTDVVQFSSSHHCNKICNEYFNGKSNDIPDESFSRRIINLLLSHMTYEENGDIIIGNIVTEFTSSELNKLKSFGKGETDIRDIDPILSNIFRPPEKYSFRDIFLIIQQMCMEAIIHKEIVLVTLITFYMTWIILTTKWSKLKLIGTGIIIIFVASFIITYLQLLKEAEIKNTVKQMMYMNIPIHCQPEKMSWWNKITSIFSTSDKCHEYFEGRMENRFLQVTPAQVLSHMLATVVVQPSHLIGEAISGFAHNATKHLWFPLGVTIEPLLIILIIILGVIAMICSFGGSFSWGMGPFSLFSLRGGQSADNRYISSTEKREPIELILNVKVSNDNQTHQLAVGVSKEDNAAGIASIKNEEPEKEVESVAVAETKGKSILNFNSASGDSNISSSLLSLENDKSNEESQIKNIVEELGSGDN